MKKLVLILMVGFICTTIIAQTSNEVTKEELAATQIIDQVFDRTTEAVQQISDALKVPAEHVYSVLVRQQIINSISWIIALLLGFIFCYLGIKLPLKDHKATNEREKYKNDITDGWWIWAIALSVGFGMILSIVTVLAITDIITGFTNPEYGAIKDILSIL
jgi:hypothetical protein